jgi:hypothetical protein
MIETLEEAIEAAIEIAERITLRGPAKWDSEEAELLRLLRLIETLTERERT